MKRTFLFCLLCACCLAGILPENREDSRPVNPHKSTVWIGELDHGSLLHKMNTIDKSIVAQYMACR